MCLWKKCIATTCVVLCSILDFWGVYIFILCLLQYTKHKKCFAFLIEILSNSVITITKTFRNGSFVCSSTSIPLLYPKTRRGPKKKSKETLDEMWALLLKLNRELNLKYFHFEKFKIFNHQDSSMDVHCEVSTIVRPTTQAIETSIIKLTIIFL